MTEVFLGIDVGTSGVKIVIVDEQERFHHEASAPLATSHPRPGWSEQDPSDWWEAVDGLARGIEPELARRIAAIGLSGQMHGLVCLDAAGAVLRPAILWNDARAGAECARLNELVPEIESIAGVRAVPGLTAPKLLWMRAHEPDVFAATAKLLLPKDDVRRRMTGDIATDPSDASGTLLLDVAERNWAGELIEACGLSEESLPPIVDGSAVAGRLSSAVAAGWGMERVPVACGAGDAVAGSIGIGAVKPGNAFLSLGTSGQIFVSTDAHRPSPGTLIHAFAHALPGLWFQAAAMLNGASALAWWARTVGKDVGALLADVESAPQPSSPDHPLFLPYLTGERTPLDDPNARGVFFDLLPDTDQPAMTRAVMEGVAYAFALGFTALESAGANPQSLIAVGGGARSAAWMQMFADVLERPIERPENSERGPAVGAARLARLAVGCDADAVLRPPATVRRFQPAAGASEHHRLRLERFRQVYAALKPIWS